MTNKTKTTSKILGTSIVAFAVLAMMAPANMAHADLIGDDVTIELVNGDVANDPDNVSSTKTKTVTNGLGAEFSWQDGGCGAPDEDIDIDIEGNTISVFVADNFGVFCVFNSNGEIIDAPLTFNISSLDWVDQPQGEVVGITVSSNLANLFTTQNVIDGHSVQITIAAKDALSVSSATIVFELEKKVIVDVDLKPQSCPNPVNVLSKGLVPVAILGTAEFDVNDIDISTLPDRTQKHTIEDVASPFGGPIIDQFDCTEDGPDGFDDLIFKIPMEDIICLPDGVLGILVIDGQLLDGTDFEGSDLGIVINKKGC